MKNTSTALGLFASALLAGCGPTGGSTAYTAPILKAAPTATPTAVAATATPTASAASVLPTASIGGVTAFVTAAGFAVYIFTGDTTANQSNCTGGCLAVWPAVLAPAGALPAPWTSFTRADNGQLQLAYNGQPLYTFVSDTQPGVATGIGVEGFELATPLPSTSAPTATPTAAPTAAPTASPTASPVPTPTATSTPYNPYRRAR